MLFGKLGDIAKTEPGQGEFTETSFVSTVKSESDFISDIYIKPYVKKNLSCLDDYKSVFMMQSECASYETFGPDIFKCKNCQNVNN